MKQLSLLAALCVLVSTWSCQKPESELLKSKVVSSSTAVKGSFLSETTTTTSTATTVCSKVTVDNYGTCNMITYTPAGASVSNKLPVIVFTPGNGEVGTDASKLYLHGPLRFIKNGWQPDFVVVGIQPLYGCDSRSPRFAHAMLTAIRQNPLVDTNQVYMTGLSGGAFTTLRYIRDYPAPYRVRATMVFSIDMYPKCSGELCGNDLRFKNIPTWGMCGDIDTRMEPSMKKYFSLLTGAGFPAQYNEYSGGHYGWDTYYNPTWTKAGYSVYTWLLKWGTATTSVSSAPVYRYLKVNVTDSAHLITTAGWNNLVDTVAKLTFTSGTLSGITAKINYKTALSKNSSAYATTISSPMAPAAVLQTTSYSYKARKLTLHGLNPAKTYNLELYASRDRNSGEQTIFTIGTDKVVPTYLNYTNKVVFSGIKPDNAGNLVIGIRSAISYNYLNGFSLTEITN